MTNQILKPLPLSAACCKIVDRHHQKKNIFTGLVHISELLEILALHCLNLSVMETAKQTVETKVPVSFAFFGQTRTKDKIMSVTQLLSDKRFWSQFRISLPLAKMQPHLNEVILKCSLDNEWHTTFSSGVRTWHNLSVDWDLYLIGQTRKQFTLIDSLMND